MAKLLDLSLNDVMENGVIQKRGPVFCQVWLNGIPTDLNSDTGILITGIEYLGKTEFEIFELAYMVYKDDDFNPTPKR